MNKASLENEQSKKSKDLHQERDVQVCFIKQVKQKRHLLIAGTLCCSSLGLPSPIQLISSPDFPSSCLTHRGPEVNTEPHGAAGMGSPGTSQMLHQAHLNVIICPLALLKSSPSQFCFQNVIIWPQLGRFLQR